jgi:hypothetical protein
MVFLNPIAILMATLFSIVIAAPTATGPAAPTATDLTNTLDVATPGTRCGSLTRKWGGEDELHPFPKRLSLGLRGKRQLRTLRYLHVRSILSCNWKPRSNRSAGTTIALRTLLVSVVTSSCRSTRRRVTGASCVRLNIRHNPRECADENRNDVDLRV